MLIITLIVVLFSYKLLPTHFCPTRYRCIHLEFPVYMEKASSQLLTIITPLSNLR